MEPNPHSLESALPTFLIPVGTQVVLKTDKRIPGGEAFKPSGTVGEVIEAPTSNRQPYLVRFLDGVTLRLKFGELAIRRGELDATLTTPGIDLRPYAIYCVAVGSRAFGLATDASDEDRRG